MITAEETRKRTADNYKVLLDKIPRIANFIIVCNKEVEMASSCGFDECQVDVDLLEEQERPVKLYLKGLGYKVKKQGAVWRLRW